MKIKNLKQSLLASFVVATLVFTFAGVANADQPTTKSNNGNAGENPNFMNGRQEILEPGMEPVITTPTRELVNATVKSGRATLYVGTADNSDIIYRVTSPVMTSFNVQLIWYGSWQNTASTTPSANNYQGFTEKFLNDLSNSPRWNLNSTYYQANSSSVPNGSVSPSSFVNKTFAVRTSVNVKRNQAKYREPLTQSSIYNIAKDNPGSAGIDQSTIYIVITSADIKVKGFGTSFCGWHSFSSSNKMKYSFVGDPASISGCLPQNIGPNLYGADAMLSVLVHEIEEAATDPQLNAWYSSNGAENSDKCAWTWGSAYSTSNGSAANINLGGKDYLIQQGFKMGSLRTSNSSTHTWSGVCAVG